MQSDNCHLRLNLGCGLRIHPSWINVDGSWNARLAKFPFLRKALSSLHILPAGKEEVPWSRDIFIHDIRKPLPFSDSSADAVYASHVLEHLYREQGQQLIREASVFWPQVELSASLCRTSTPSFVNIWVSARSGNLPLLKKHSLRETFSMSGCSCAGRRPQDTILYCESTKLGRISTRTNGCMMSSLSPTCSVLSVLLTLLAETTPRA